MLNAKPQFEQIPVEVVRKIIQRYVSSPRQAESASPVTEDSAKHRAPHIEPDRGSKGELEMGDLSADPSSLQYPEWQKALQEALLEFDKDKLKVRIAKAEAAILKRQQIISQSTTLADGEQQALRDGLASLSLLKRQALGSPDRQER